MLLGAVAAAVHPIIGFTGAERFCSADDQVEFVLRGMLGPPEAARAILRSVAARGTTSASERPADHATTPTASTPPSVSATFPPFPTQEGPQPSFPRPPGDWFFGEPATAPSLLPHVDSAHRQGLSLEQTSAGESPTRASSPDVQRQQWSSGRESLESVNERMLYNMVILCLCVICLADSWWAAKTWLKPSDCGKPECSKNCGEAECRNALLLCASVTLNGVWVLCSMLAELLVVSYPWCSTCARVLQVHALHVFVGVRLSPPAMPPALGLGVVVLGSSLIDAFHRGRLRRTLAAPVSVNQVLLFSLAPFVSQGLMLLGIGRACSGALAVISLQLWSERILREKEAKPPSTVAETKSACATKSGVSWPKKKVT